MLGSMEYKSGFWLPCDSGSKRVISYIIFMLGVKLLETLREMFFK